MKFIAAMDHSGGSTGGVLERYNIEYTEDNKMDLVHDMRLRMVNSPDFNDTNIRAAILYKDTVERGMVPLLNSKNIDAFLKIDSGCNDNGTLKVFDISSMCEFAVKNKCIGTKMRSIVKSLDNLVKIVDQQFELATTINRHCLIPIIEPEVPINHPEKAEIENNLRDYLETCLNKYDIKCILKLTIPNTPDLYHSLSHHPNVNLLVGLSGGYTTTTACKKLSRNRNMSASFSRALSENLFAHQSDSQFEAQLKDNIRNIKRASE